jgi:hypothetical protein
MAWLKKAWDWCKLHTAAAMAAVGGAFLFLGIILAESSRKGQGSGQGASGALEGLDRARLAERARATSLAKADGLKARRVEVEAKAETAKAETDAKLTAIQDMEANQLIDEWERLKK